MLSTETSNSESDIGVAKSKDEVSGWRDFGFNLCVVPFPNIYVPNFKLERLMSELFGVVQRLVRVVGGVGGLKVHVVIITKQPN